jgi:YebC/PmpR family DNA-binding regulatory protein
VALLIDAATDNRNRTVADVRHLLNKGGGSMGEAGCVNWMFERKGVFGFPKDKYAEDQLLEIGLEAGAEDVIDDGDEWTVHASVEDFMAVQEAFEAAGLEWDEAELTMVPKTTVDVDVEVARKLLRLMDMLEDNDDVQKVHANFDIPDDVMAELENE